MINLKNKKIRVQSSSTFLRNRRGDESTFLSVETLKILIAVICITGLIYLLAKIWYSSSGETDLNQAEASLNNIIFAEIQRISDGGEENPKGILVPNPSGWYIIGFTEDIKPNSCVGKKCICICDVYFFNTAKSQAEKCDSDGVCAVVEDLIAFDKVKIQGAGIFLPIKKTNNGIEVGKWA